MTSTVQIQSHLDRQPLLGVFLILGPATLGSIMGSITMGSIMGSSMGSITMGSSIMESKSVTLGCCLETCLEL